MIPHASLFSFDFPPLDGGIARLCSDLALGLARNGARVAVLTAAVGERNAENGKPCDTLFPSVARLTPNRPWRELAALKRLRRLRGQGPVICGIWYPEGLIAVLAGVKPLVILAHGSELMPVPSRLRRGLWKRLLRWTLARADLIIADSSYTKALVEKCSPGCQATAIPLAVDHARFSPGDRAAAKSRHGVEGKRVLLSVGRVYRYKGHDVVFRALAALPEEARRKCVYLIAGKGPDREWLKAEARRLAVENVVRWLGYIPDSDLPEFYRAADLFVLCTRENAAAREVEGFGLAFLEAQACATPVVGTRTGGIPDAVKEGAGGWLIAQDDHAALARILRQLVDDPDRFARADAAVRMRVERECTWERYFERFIGELSTRGIDLV